MTKEMIISSNDHETRVAILEDDLVAEIFVERERSRGVAGNVIPDEAVLRGTVRTFSTEVLDHIEARMRQVAQTLPQVYGATGELQFVRAYPPLVNWDEQTEFATQVAQDVFGVDKVIRDVAPVGGAEDFSFYLEKVPGTYLFLGNGDGGHREATYHGMGPCELHNPNYDFNDTLLPVGATYWVKLVQAFFART